MLGILDIFMLSTPMLTTLSLEEKLEKIELACKWLQSLGINTSKTRLLTYKNYYKEYVSNYSRFEEDPGKIAYFLRLMREAEEITWIFEGFKSEQNPKSIRIIKESIGGTVFSATDAPNNRSRDYLFELRIASYYRRAGFDAKIGTESDVIVQKHNQTIYVECKRLKSIKKVEVRLKEAAIQLDKRYKDHSNKSDLFGIFAVDLSAIINPESGFLIRLTHDEGTDYIREKMNHFFDKYNPAKYFSKDNRNLAVWCHFMCPSLTTATDPPLSTRYTSLVNPLCPLSSARGKILEDFRIAFKRSEHISIEELKA
ncbi:MAG: hypothetical protein A2W27_03720 [Deltaproteobacteria bacterium RBG_16_44_11]|nr:MAG: hypothetical protein A2W27_03720 [Deltaproteobacteria bacterium RBG_16_44_11]